MPYSTQYNPWLDAAGAVQRPARQIGGLLAELPQQRAQARVLDSQYQQNVANTGLIGERMNTERAQGGLYTQQAAKAEQEAKNLEALRLTLERYGKPLGELATGNTNSPDVMNMMHDVVRISGYNGAPNLMQQAIQGQNFIAAGNDPIARAAAQNTTGAVPFNRSVGETAQTPSILPNGAMQFGAAVGTNPPTMTANNPKSFNPQSTSAAKSAYIAARSRLQQAYLRGISDITASPEQKQQMKAELDSLIADLDNAWGAQEGEAQGQVPSLPMPVPGSTNAPSMTPAVKRYNPATRRLE